MKSGTAARPLQPRQSCLSKILESWLVKLIKLWSFADVISDRGGSHQLILLPEHYLSNCGSMDVCSWWRLRRQGDRKPLTDYIWLGGDPFDSTRQVFAARLFTALKSAIKSLDKLLHWVCRAQTSGPILLLPNMDQIKPSSHTRLALLLKTNTGSYTRQHWMTCLIAQSLSNDTTRMHIACWLLKV